MRIIKNVLRQSGKLGQGGGGGGEQYAKTQRRWVFLSKFNVVMFVSKYCLNLQAYTHIIIIQGQK